MNKKGFSLIELMVVLITISAVLAAFAPMISKKLKTNAISVTQNQLRTTICASKWADCAACTLKECIYCKKTCANNQKMDIANCTCVSCGSNCATCTQNTCTSCNAGYGLSDGSCVACGEGTYSDGTTACQKAPAGHYVKNDDRTKFIACPVGQFQNETGKSSCKVCSTEYPGTYQNQTGQTYCKVCPEGYSCSNSSATISACTGNTGSKRGSLTCEKCKPHDVCTQCQDPDVCLKCSDNGSWYLNDRTCSSCPSGYKCDGSAGVKVN